MIRLISRGYWRARFQHSEPTGDVVLPSRPPDPGPLLLIERIDHIVLTVTDVSKALEFYSTVLGMSIVCYNETSYALRFGSSKINLHEAGRERQPCAARPTPGSADVCLVTETPPAYIRRRLDHCGVTIEVGPVARQGALGPITSYYFRDPDENLIEVSSY